MKGRYHIIPLGKNNPQHTSLLATQPLPYMPKTDPALFLKMLNVLVPDLTAASAEPATEDLELPGLDIDTAKHITAFPKGVADRRGDISHLETIRVSTPPAPAEYYQQIYRPRALAAQAPASLKNRGTHVQAPASSKRKRGPIRWKRHALFLLKASGITLCFLIDIPFVTVLLAQQPTYQIVNVIIALILYSNLIGYTLHRHYGITLDLFKTTLHLRSVKAPGSAQAAATAGHPNRHTSLRDLQDTTAYLHALKLTFTQKPTSKERNI